MKSIKEIFRSYGILDEQGRHTNGTDKETNHSYGDAYEKILNGVFGPGCDSRHQVKLIMEIGITDGSSLLAWSEVFPNATCVGMDIHHPSKLPVSSRFEFCKGDQRSQADCEFAASNRQFDFICEDATHILEDSLITLLFLWKFVKPGGLYVIEEFANIGALRENIKSLWSNVEIVDTKGPFGGIEPLVVFRKPL